MSMNPERDTEILRRWEARESSGAIGRALKISRSTVSGVVHRAKKQRGEPNTTEAKRAAGRKANAARWAGHVRKPKTNRTIATRTRKLRQREYAAAQAQAIETATAPPDPAPIGERCTLLDLTDKKCRWPIGDPGQEGFFFCGGKTIESLPYCGYHCRVAYRPRGSDQ